ncbi:hypothetical protein AMATHDRAFT_154517 [Amanita thiersii Skay4041]|uniref:CHAT domain-containing protein n=1 Tax=Amanita thiersii Skay4041 TaxID=703135 RepID=A0A2A9NB73_9AGAR|nr:hypothetical protein AMATHDRAFT_154517 [Amanita thiersii Skay4041]
MKYLGSINDLAGALESHFESTSDSDSIAEAVRLYREALTLWSEQDANYSLALFNMAHSLWNLYNDTDKVNTLNESVLYYRKAVQQVSPKHPRYQRILNGLAVCLELQFTHSKELAVLNECIQIHRDLLAAQIQSKSDIDIGESMNNLSIALETLYRQTNDKKTLEEALDLHRQALKHTPPGPDYADAVYNLAKSLIMVYEHDKNLEALEEAISVFKQALNMMSKKNAKVYADVLEDLGEALNYMSSHDDDVKYLVEAIGYHRQVLDFRNSDHPQYAIAHRNLAYDLENYYTEVGGKQNLLINEALTLYRELLAEYPKGHENFPGVANKLALTLEILFSQTGKESIVQESISLFREGLSACLPEDRQYVILLGGLSNTLDTYYRAFGGREKMEEAIALHREQLKLLDASDRLYPGTLNNLAVKLETWFDIVGDRDILEEAIKTERDALVYAKGSERAESLHNLASILETHFRHNGETARLEEAIKLYREVLEIWTPDMANYVLAINSLANALHTNYLENGRNKENLDEAISFHKQALQLRPPGHVYYADSANNLAMNLVTEFEFYNKLDSLDEAVVLYRGVVEHRSPEHPSYAENLVNLADALGVTFGVKKDISILEEAIQLSRQALKLRPVGYNTHALFSGGLAKLLENFFDQTGDTAAMAEAVELMIEAVNSSVSVLDSILYAGNWIWRATKCHHSSILDAYAKYLELLGEYVSLGTHVEFQLDHVKAHQGNVASDGTAYAIQLNNLPMAVELLEHGRTVVWSQIQGFNISINLSSSDHNELAEHLTTISSQLFQHTISLEDANQYASNVYKHSPLYEARMLSRVQLVEDWRKTVHRIQQIPGFEDFQVPGKYDKLKAAAIDGPVIVLNCSDVQCDALIVIHNQNFPVLVPLSKVTHASATHLIETLQESIGLDKDLLNTIKKVLRLLWKTIAERIVTKLQEYKVELGSHIWWCPSGVLAALPLHSACMGFKPEDDRVSKFYISSYVPTLASLTRAREMSVENIQHVMDEFFVAIGVSDTSIPTVQKELEGLGGICPSINTFWGDSAKYKDIAPQLNKASWLHLACHGILAQESPLRSHFQLAGEDTLSVLDLMKLKLPRAELAFLSACYTAVGDNYNFPDEALHLAAAVFFAGFKSVIGSLWAISDSDGPILTSEFYKYMFRNGVEKVNVKESAKGLQVAVEALQKQPGMTPNRWIQLIHIGI